MGFATVSGKLAKHWKDQIVASAPDIDVVFENTRRGEDSPEEWIAIDVLPAVQKRVEVSTNGTWRRSGLLQTTMHVPVADATGRLNELEDIVSAIGRAGSMAIAGGPTVQFRSQDLTTLGVVGQHYARVVSVNFQWDE